VKIGQAVRPGRRIEIKRQEQDRTGQSKKSQSINISPIWGEAALYRLKSTFASRWQSFKMKFSGVTISQGGRFSHFPIDLCMGITALPR